MNFEFDAVMLLALFTLGAVLVWGILSYLRAKRAKDHHHDAAVAQRQRTEDAEVSLSTAPGDDLKGPNDSGRSWSEERGVNPPTPMPPPD
jgi:hypothetical protein